MKIAAIVGASVLGLALATSAPAYAQHGHDDDHHGGPDHHQGNEARNDHHQAPPQHGDYHQGPPQHGDYHQANRPEPRHDVRPPEHHEAYRPEVHQPHYRQADEHARDYRHEAPHPPTHNVWERERAG